MINKSDTRGPRTATPAIIKVYDTRGLLTALLVQIKKSKIQKKFYKTKNDNLPALKICKSAANVIFPFLETPTLTFEHIPRPILKGEGTNHKMENVWSPYNIRSTKNPK